MPRQALSRAEAKRLRALKQRAHREEAGLFLAEGVRIVEELADSPVVLRSAVISPSVEDSERGRRLVARVADTVPVYTASEAELRELADTDAPQGIIASAVIPEESLPEVAPGRILVLDGVQDPGNFGTLLRSAVAFGAGLVVTLPGTVDPWNAKAVRAAAGTSFHVPVVTSEADAFKSWCTRTGVAVWGAAADGESIASLDVPLHVALVLGNEGSGIRAETRSVLDRVVALRMSGRAESLNAGVAGGILLYLLSERQA